MKSCVSLFSNGHISCYLLDNGPAIKVNQARCLVCHIIAQHIFHFKASSDVADRHGEQFTPSAVSLTELSQEKLFTHLHVMPGPYANFIFPFSCMLDLFFLTCSVFTILHACVFGFWNTWTVIVCANKTMWQFFKILLVYQMRQGRLNLLKNVFIKNKKHKRRRRKPRPVLIIK